MWLCKQCKCLHSIRPTLRPQCWQQQQQQQQSNNQPGKNKKSNHLGQFIQAGNEGGKQKLKSTGEATVHNTTTNNNNIQTINQEKLKSNLPVAVVQGGRKKNKIKNERCQKPKTIKPVRKRNKNNNGLQKKALLQMVPWKKSKKHLTMVKGAKNNTCLKDKQKINKTNNEPRSNSHMVAQTIIEENKNSTCARKTNTNTHEKGKQKRNKTTINCEAKVCCSGWCPRRKTKNQKQQSKFCNTIGFNGDEKKQ